MRIRRLRPGPDIHEVFGFLARLEAETGIPPLGESKFVDLGGPLRGVGLVAEREEIVGYAHVLWHEASGIWEMEVAAGLLSTHR